MSGATPALGEIFRQEAGERLDEIVSALIEVEAGRPRPDAVDELFRHAHSIKGSAGMVGFEQARIIAAAIEEQLEHARSGGRIAPEEVPALLDAADSLRTAIATDPDPPVATPLDPPTAPATTVRVPTAKVDRMLDAVGETVLHHRRLEHELAGAPMSDELGAEIGRAERLLEELQEAVLDMRTLPLSSITSAFPRAVRDVASAAGKEVDLTITGADTQLDRVLLEGMSDSIIHLLRNAVAHGIEGPDERRRAGKPPRGRIELHAEARGGLVAIEVRDDGRGVSANVRAHVDADQTSLVDVLTRAGFSTAAEVNDLAGRGVGLDAVRSRIEAVGGSIAIETDPGRGTSVTMMLPVTLALLRVLIVERAGQRYGLPLASVDEAVAIEQPLTIGGRMKVAVRDERLWVVDLVRVLGGDAPALEGKVSAAIVRSGASRVGLACERVVSEDDVLVRPLGFAFTGVQGYLGAAILEDGTILPILDPSFVARAGASPAAAALANTDGRTPGSERPNVLVVDDQFTVRELQRSILGASGYRVQTASDGREALELLASAPSTIDLVVTDLQMPNMGGLELVRAIRADSEHAHMPVIVVTSQGTDEDRARGADAGADAYIVKDEFDQRALLATVQSLVGHR
jgi:two-component system chemotaxis sensor kinase CheA